MSSVIEEYKIKTQKPVSKKNVVLLCSCSEQTENEIKKNS